MGRSSIELERLRTPGIAFVPGSQCPYCGRAGGQDVGRSGVFVLVEANQAQGIQEIWFCNAPHVYKWASRDTFEVCGICLVWTPRAQMSLGPEGQAICQVCASVQEYAAVDTKGSVDYT